MLNESLNINGFTIVRLSIPDNIIVNDSVISPTNPTHCLYLKEHTVKKYHPSKPPKRTLFVCNVPPYLNEEAIKAIFQAAGCGKIQNVFLHLKPEVGSQDDMDQLPKYSKYFPNPEEMCFTGKFAYVVFRNSSGVETSMKLPHDRPLEVTMTMLGEAACRTGVDKWCHEYRQSTADFDLSQLEKEIQSFVGQYDDKKLEDEKREKMAEGQDDDGWVKVSRKRGARFTEAEQQHQHRKEKKRKEEQELVHFYRFQLRESRREKIAELRKRFEEDKQRIALLRQQRKFKPF